MRLLRFIATFVAALALSVLFGAPTFAADSLSITVDGAPNITLESNTLGTGSVDVYVTTASATGYTLNITDSDEDNALTSDFGTSVSPLSASVTAENFTTNAWGVKVGDSFLPIPKFSDKPLELRKTSAAADNEKTTVTFGAKVDGTLASGSYSSNVIITAITNAVPLRQTTLKTGTEVNSVWKTISGTTTQQSTQYIYRDTTTTSIQRYTGEFTDALRSAAVNIATADSGYPVYTWYDANTIYYYTEADIIYLNANSSYLFYNLEKVESIDAIFGTAEDADPTGASGPIFSTEGVTNMAQMFQNARVLAALDVSKFDTSNVTNMNSMFSGLSAVTTLDVSKWDVSKVTDMTTMFNAVKSVTTLDVSKWNTGAVTVMSGMFQQTESLTTLDVSKWNTSAVTKMTGMFVNTPQLSYIDVSKWDVSHVTSMNTTFYNSGFTRLDVSKWNTGSVTDMNSMFSYATNLTELDVSKWDVSNVRSMGGMFSYMTLANIDVSEWQTTNLLRTDNMFEENTGIVTIDVSDWDTSKLQNASKMFKGATNLTTVDVSDWDTSSLQNISYILQNASSVTEFDVSGWTTTSLQNMAQAFNGASSITVLDFTSWDTSNVNKNYVTGMFNGATSLTTIYANDNFLPSGVSNSTVMFKDATSLVGGNGTRYSATGHAGAAYAHIDVDGNPGYFTAK